MPLSLSEILWGHLLEHPFLEHFFLGQFSVVRGSSTLKGSQTPRLVEHFSFSLEAGGTVAGSVLLKWMWWVI